MREIFVLWPHLMYKIS